MTLREQWRKHQEDIGDVLSIYPYEQWLESRLSDAQKENERLTAFVKLSPEHEYTASLEDRLTKAEKDEIK